MICTQALKLLASKTRNYLNNRRFPLFFISCKDFVIRWVDDTHALIVLSDPQAGK